MRKIMRSGFCFFQIEVFLTAEAPAVASSVSSLCFRDKQGIDRKFVPERVKLRRTGFEWPALSCAAMVQWFTSPVLLAKSFKSSTRTSVCFARVSENVEQPLQLLGALRCFERLWIPHRYRRSAKPHAVPCWPRPKPNADSATSQNTGGARKTAARRRPTERPCALCARDDLHWRFVRAG